MRSLLPSQSSIRITVSSEDYEILSACNEMSFSKRVVFKEHFLAHSVHSRHQTLDWKLHVGPCGPETQWLAFLEDIPRCEVMGSESQNWSLSCAIIFLLCGLELLYFLMSEKMKILALLWELNTIVRMKHVIVNEHCHCLRMWARSKGEMR